jgi:hypothetical protein
MNRRSQIDSPVELGLSGFPARLIQLSNERLTGLQRDDIHLTSVGHEREP